MERITQPLFFFFNFVIQIVITMADINDKTGTLLFYD